MQLGISIRNAGVAANRDNILTCSRAAEEAGLDSLWLFDHIAIPPDDAEGSDGIYFDPLATLEFIAGCTERIQLGVGVLILPYRPALLTAKWIASIQALSNERLLLGVGVGWMEAEFKALGVAREERGKITDDTLKFLHGCFSDDVMTANGQEFLFKPRPARPPIYIGGKPPHATDRALAWGDGWIPIGKGPNDLAPDIAHYREQAQAAGKNPPEVVTFGQLPLNDAAAARDTCAAYEEAGVTHLVHGVKYKTADEFMAELAGLRDFLDSGTRSC